jgi:trk system potassium uptake protein TrkA
MNVIVVGCGRVGAELAYRLFQRGNKVTVIDQVSQSFKSLPSDFRGRTLEGEALNQDLLRRAGIAKAEGLAAVTNSDAINAVVAHAARSVYHVPMVVVRNYDPRWRSLHEAFGLQVVSSAAWGAQRLEELLYQSEIRTVFSAGNGEVEIYEFATPDRWVGRALKDMLPPDGCFASAVTRAGRALLPQSELSLQAGDVVLVSATLDGIEALRMRIAWPGEG